MENVRVWAERMLIIGNFLEPKMKMKGKKKGKKGLIAISLLTRVLSIILLTGSSTLLLAKGKGVSVSVEDADLAFSAFLKNFWNPQLKYLSDQNKPDTHPTAYWTYAQGWDCVLDNIALHKKLSGINTLIIVSIHSY